MLDKFHDECGVVGVYGHADAANLVYLGLYALQHRGQESAGISVSDGESIQTRRGQGLVSEVFSNDEYLNIFIFKNAIVFSTIFFLQDKVGGSAKEAFSFVKLDYGLETL